MNNATGRGRKRIPIARLLVTPLVRNVNTKGNTKEENGPSGYRTRSHKDVPIVRREGRGNRRLGRAAARQTLTLRSAPPPHRPRDESADRTQALICWAKWLGGPLAQRYAGLPSRMSLGSCGLRLLQDGPQ